MNRKQLEAAVGAAIGGAKRDAQQAVEAVLAAISAAIAAGEEVRLTDFGTFGIRQAAARAGRNPHTGAAIEIPAGRRVTFRPSATLKRRAA